MRLRQLITALGLNAVPAIGWFIDDWSAGTTLLLYWLETLIGTFLVAGRIVLHRRILPSKGHWHYQAPDKQQLQTGNSSTYLSAFLVPALGFTFVHGIFLGALGGILYANHHAAEVAIQPRSLLVGVIGVALFQVFDFLLDVIWLRGRSFRWIEVLGQQSMARVIVIHLTIIGGMMAVMFTGANRNFFGVFVFLKTMLNCSLALPQWNPKTPPAWLCRLLDRVGSTKYKNTTFAEFWHQTDVEEEARIARNEKPQEPEGRERQKNAASSRRRKH